MQTIKSTGLMLGVLFLFSISVSAQSPLSTKTTLSKFQIGGFIQPKYAFTNDSTKTSGNGFGIRRFEVKISAELNEQIGMELTYDFGAMKSGVGGDLRDAFIRYTYNDWIKIQMGQFKKPMLKEEFLISSSAIRMIDRGLIDKSLADNFYADRDMGIMLNGDGYNDDLPFEYWIGAFNGNGRNQSSDDNSAKQFVAHLEYSPMVGLVLGGDVSVIGFDNNYKYDKKKLKADSTLSIDKTIYRSAQGLNVEFAYEDLSIISEYYTWENHITPFSTSKKVLINSFQNPSRSSGFYVNPIYLFRFQNDFISKLDVGIKYEQLDTDVRIDNNTKQAITVGTSVYLNENGSRFQLNYIKTDDEALKAKKVQSTFHEIVAQFTIKF